MTRKRSIPIKQPIVKEKQKSFKKNKKIVTCMTLILICFLVLFMNSYFNYTSGIAFNPDGDTIGTRFYLAGPDPYYNMRLCEQTLERGYYPFVGEEADPLLRYPIGLKNSARPPLFNMIAVGVAKLGGNFMSEMDALGWAMLFLPAIYGALLVFPIFGIGKELFNKKIGLIAAMFIPIIPVHLGSGHGSSFSLFDHDSFILLLTTMVLYFLIKSFKEKDKKKSIIYALLSGVCIASIELTWVASQFIFTFILLFMIVQMFFDVFRNNVKTIENVYKPTIALSAAFLIVLPFNMLRDIIFAFPFYTLIISIFICFIYYTLKKLNLPGIISTASILSIAGLSLLFLYFINIGIVKISGVLATVSNIIFGSGIYGQKVSLTIGEAHTFNISQTVMSFGPVLFWIGMAGFILFVIHTYKNKWKPENILFITMFIVNMWLLTIAGRFINDMIPVISVFAAYFTYTIIKKIDYKSMIKNMRNIQGFRKIRGMKYHHIFGILFVLLLLLPNAYCSLDAAVPGALKSDIFGEEHRGAWGTGLSQQYYWSDACYWLSQQDTEIENPADRPGFMSWWDYGFYESSMGGHPTVADNFQSGIPPAANFHTAKTEKEAVSILITLISYAAYRNNYLDDIKPVLEKYNSTELINIIKNPSSYNKLIAPEWGNKELRVNGQNAMYHDSVEFLSKFTDEEITMFYHDIMESTGKSIRYYAVESYDTQIFGVFSFLADKGTHGYSTNEDDYFATRYRDSITGMEYTYEEATNLSQNEIQNMDLNPVTIRKEGFFNTMFFKTFYGFTDNNQISEQRYPTYGLRHFYPVYFSPQVIITKYYEGARINGTVNIQGIPYVGAQVYVMDDVLGIPHDLATIGSDGSFSVIAPPGNITLMVAIGENKIDERVFNTLENPPITEGEAMRILDSKRNISFDIMASSVNGFFDLNTTESNLKFTIKGMNTNIEKTMNITDVSYSVEGLIPDTYQFIITNSSGIELYKENKFLSPSNNVFNITIW